MPVEIKTCLHLSCSRTRFTYANDVMMFKQQKQNLKHKKERSHFSTQHRYTSVQLLFVEKGAATGVTGFNDCVLIVCCVMLCEGHACKLICFGTACIDRSRTLRAIGFILNYISRMNPKVRVT